VSNVFLYVGLFNVFRADFRLLFLVRNMEGVHFCSKTDKFSMRHRPGFALELAEDTIICFQVERVRGFKVTRVEQM